MKLWQKLKNNCYVIKQKSGYTTHITLTPIELDKYYELCIKKSIQVSLKREAKLDEAYRLANAIGVPLDTNLLDFIGE